MTIAKWRWSGLEAVLFRGAAARAWLPALLVVLGASTWTPPFEETAAYVRAMVEHVLPLVPAARAPLSGAARV